MRLKLAIYPPPDHVCLPSLARSLCLCAPTHTNAGRPSRSIILFESAALITPLPLSARPTKRCERKRGSLWTRPAGARSSTIDGGHGVVHAPSTPQVHVHHLTNSTLFEAGGPPRIACTTSVRGTLLGRVAGVLRAGVQMASYKIPIGARKRSKFVEILLAYEVLSMIAV